MSPENISFSKKKRNWTFVTSMGLCSGDEECPVLESTERVKTGHAKKYTSKLHSWNIGSFLYVFVFREVVWKQLEGCWARVVHWHSAGLAWWGQLHFSICVQSLCFTPGRRDGGGRQAGQLTWPDSCGPVHQQHPWQTWPALWTLLRSVTISRSLFFKSLFNF